MDKALYSHKGIKLSAYRRLSSYDSFERTNKVIINEDGSVFDKITKKKFTTITEWIGHNNA